jgi:hypothetical protein
MANPPAGSTPTYHLRWPGGPNPAEGPTGYQNLATDTETAMLGALPLSSSAPWVMMTVAAGTLAASANTAVAFTIRAQHAANWFSMGGTQNLLTTRPGVYSLDSNIRTLATGTPASGTWLQAYWSSTGAAVMDTVAPLWGAGWLDIIGSFSFHYAAPVSGSGLTCVIQNSSTQNQTLNGGWFSLTWLGD